MYNLRYHLITVVAIFFALAVGLLLGAAVGGSEALRQTSSSLVENLRKDYTEAVKKRDELTAQLTENDKFTSEFVNHWMQHRLTGKNIVLFTDSDSTACAERIDDLVAQAGGSLVRISLTKTDLSDDKYASVRTELKKLLGITDDSKLRQELSKRLIDEWGAGALHQSSSNPIWNLITSKANQQAPDQQSSQANQHEAAQPSSNETHEDTQGGTDKTASSSTSSQTDQNAHTQDQAGQTSGQTGQSGHSGGAAQNQSHPITEFAIKNKLLTVHASGDVTSLDGVVTCALSDKNKPHKWALELTAAAQAKKIPAVVTQLGNSDDDLIIEAQSRGFSSMAACDTLVGGYGVIALLTGATGGAYGLEGMVPYPPLP